MTRGSVRPKTDIARLWNELETARRIGATEAGGVRRLALDAADGEMRSRIQATAQALGCEVRVDRIGNIFCRRPGHEPDSAPVVIGSHLDTQVEAGAYDGTLGVLAGLEVVRALDEVDAEHQRPIEVVAWTSEEGARFLPPTLGSKVWAGGVALGDALAITDDAGISVGEALQAIEGGGPCPVPGQPFAAYYELHIEQGPVLDESGVDVGLVTGGHPVRAFRVEIRGEASHAGPTPMASRRSSLVGAAQVIAGLDEIAGRYAPDGRTTATQISNYPDRVGVVPSRTEISVDLRHTSEVALTEMCGEFARASAVVSRESAVEISAEPIYAFPGMRFDRDLIRDLETATNRLGVEWSALGSFAAHDAYEVAKVCPATMIFCPCVGGVSHNPAEAVERDRLAPSVQVLAEAVLERARR